MNDDVTQRLLEIESSVGDQYKNTWEGFVEPFFVNKAEQLFEAFKTCPSSDVDALVAIRMQMNALDGLKEHFISYVNSGELAKRQLEDINNA